MWTTLGELTASHATGLCFKHALHIICFALAVQLKLENVILTLSHSDADNCYSSSHVWNMLVVGLAFEFAKNPRFETCFL